MIFIDLDGTLVDDTVRQYAAYVETLSLPAMRGVPLPEREYWALRRQGTDWRQLLRKSRLLPTKFDDFHERFLARREEPDLLALDVLRPGAQTALSKLHTKTPLVLLSLRADEVQLRGQLARLGIERYFAALLWGAPPLARRVGPNHRADTKIRHVRRRYRLPPTEAVLMGDTETDVAVARSFGFECYLVEGGHRDKRLQVKADPDWIVPDLPAALETLLPGGRWQR